MTIGQVALSSKSQLFSAEEFQKLQTDLHLSQKKTLEVAAALRVVTKNRKVVEPHLKQKLFQQNHSVDEYFTVKKFDFTSTKRREVSEVPETVVYCSNLVSFLQMIKDKRKLNEVLLKFGIDGGGGFLKVCLSVQSVNLEEDVQKKRQKYGDGIAANKFKDSGVNKLLVLAIAPNTQENYSNVVQLWSSLGINNFEGTVATDLKLANILVGIMSHASLYPCTWCYSSKNEMNKCGLYRTVGNSLENYLKWHEAGEKKQDAKKFMNCTNPPVFDTSQDRAILEIIPPPELHLMLGVVNTLYTNLIKESEPDALQWAQKCSVTREVYHGSSGFNGNSCRKLLSKVDLFRSNCCISSLKYVKAFDDFNAVVKACFSMKLDPNFRQIIENFKRSYLDLGISITPKVHAVFFHVPDFCAETQAGLGFYSEQATESVHSDFKRVWEKYKVGKDHPDYADRLRQATCE